MTDMSGTMTVDLLLHMLREAIEGPPGPWTYFSDRGPATGLVGTIGRLSAAAASRPAGPGHTTIAGHVHHVCANLALTTLTLRGASAPRDRDHGWAVTEVDDLAWSALRARLRREYGDTVLAVESRVVWDEDALGAAMGAVAHTAYHLGAVRQRVSAPG